MKRFFKIYPVAAILMVSIQNQGNCQQDQTPLIDFSEEPALVQELVKNANESIFRSDRLCDYELFLLTLPANTETYYYLLNYSLYTDPYCALKDKTWLLVFNKDRKYLGKYWTKGWNYGWEVVDNVLRMDGEAIRESFNEGVPEKITIGEDHVFTYRKSKNR